MLTSKTDLLDTIKAPNIFIFDHEAAASLFHELVGHGLEKNIIKNNQNLITQINPAISASDDPSVVNSPSSFQFDDQFCLARKKTLVENGKLLSYIGNLHTDYLNQQNIGNSRISYDYFPYPRMSNIIVNINNTVTKIDGEIWYINGSKNGYLYKDYIYFFPDSVEFTEANVKRKYLGLCMVFSRNGLFRAEMYGLGEFRYGNTGFCSKGKHKYLPVGYGNTQLVLRGIECQIYKVGQK